ncbi:MAG: DNA-binding protein [Verrucomicrobia bacterium GWF2_51_19]|nr:MAG: DNA-binding protein [Verrucomicrobia bacterium GWF2_51_19]HCJ12101.1 HU family DNA-binding protein [Opitutae bacterium]
MNKAQLIEKIQKTLGKDTSKAAAERALNAVLEGIKEGIKKEKGVQLIGFGTFSVVKRAARKGVNPRTKEKIKIAASKTVKFKPGTALKASL